MLRDARCNSSRLSTTKQDELPRISRRPDEPSGARAHLTNCPWVGRQGHPVAGAWIASMLPADASDPLLVACSHAPHTGPAYGPLLICAVFDCRTNRRQRHCRAQCARLERQAPDAPRYIEIVALPRSGCPNVSQVLGIGDPHWKLTIEAEAGLSIVSTSAKVRNLIAHWDSNKIVEPRITREGYQRVSWNRMVIRQPQINAVHATLPPSPL
jgi:hypothetical protein